MEELQNLFKDNQTLREQINEMGETTNEQAKIHVDERKLLEGHIVRL